VQLEGLGCLKNPMTSTGIEPATWHYKIITGIQFQCSQFPAVQISITRSLSDISSKFHFAITFLIFNPHIKTFFIHNLHVCLSAIRIKPKNECRYQVLLFLLIISVVTSGGCTTVPPFIQYILFTYDLFMVVSVSDYIGSDGMMIYVQESANDVEGSGRGITLCPIPAFA
jgi:hypothetical protein